MGFGSFCAANSQYAGNILMLENGIVAPVCEGPPA